MPRMREVKTWDTHFPPPGRGGRPLRSRTRKAPLLREQPIDNLPDWDKIGKMVTRDNCGGLGGTIEDIVERRATVIQTDGVTVAAVRLLLYISFDMDGERQLSDGVWITLYRNPKSPKYLKAKF